jgi:PAS domain S-box-containing protein
MTSSTAPEPALLAEQAPDGMIFASTDGTITYWNAAAERIFGLPASEALGANLDIIIPEQFRDAHWKGFERALETGETKYAGQSLPTRALRAGGEEFYVELSFALVRDGGGTILGALAHARDIDERFKRDRDMRRELRDLRAAQQASGGER